MPLANAGHYARAIQDRLGHRAIQHTARYSELSQERFKDFWRLRSLRLAKKQNRIAFGHNVPLAMHKKGGPALAPGPLRAVASIPSRMKADEF
jgi:hypothetical protein